MSIRRSAHIVWVIWALALLLLALAALLSAASNSFTIDSDLIFNSVLGIGFAIIVTVGAAIVSRQPKNKIGWLIFFSGVMWAVSWFCGAYADYVRDSQPLPARTWAAWINWWTFGPITLMIVLYWILLFPTGQPLSRRWRIVEWLLVAVIALAAINSAFGDTAIDDDGTISNPARIAFVSRFFDQTGVFLVTIGPAILGLVPLVSMVLRFRRSRGVERQQLKWLTYAVAVFIGAATTAGICAAFGLGGWLGATSWFMSLGLAIVGIPLSIGIAILRYRLYDIDVLINRTLVYVSLSVSLLAVYLALVLGIGEAALSISGENSDLTVAIAVLAVAALFRPLRNRIQSGVDRRFYRHKYDAARTLDAFSARLRDEIDLHALGEEMMAVVHETMQPTHVSIWFRDMPS